MVRIHAGVEISDPLFHRTPTQIARPWAKELRRGGVSSRARHLLRSMRGSDEAVETLTYNLADKASARVRIVNGKVASVQILD